MVVQRSDNAGLDDAVEEATSVDVDDVDEIGEPDEDVFDEENFDETPEDEAVFEADASDVEDVDVETEAGESEVTVVEEVEEEDDGEADVLVRVVEEEDEDLEDVDGLREGEFICSSCYLVKGPTQLADATGLVCVDCV